MICIVFVAFLLAAIFIPDVSAWPEGTFGLPMPKTGCPVGSVIDWETGSRTQRTEKGSHASDNTHLAGIESSPADYIVQLFCMKMSYPQESDYYWMPGKYCIFKKGECPAKFSEGYIYWDDNAKWFSGDDVRQNSKGVLPDGEFNQNTKIFYCCRNDGSAMIALRLPPSAPFYLLKSGDSCQEVENMYYTEEWVYWADESSHNLNTVNGIYPRLIRNKFSPVYTKLFYCYYQPRPPNQVLKFVLTAVYILAGIVGSVIVIVVVVCVAVRICYKCRRHKHVDNSSSMHLSPTDCQYVSIRTNDVTAATTPSAPPTESDCLSTVDHLNDDDLRSNMPPSYEEIVGPSDSNS